MSLDSAQRAVIAAAVRRTVAIATLKRIHRYIADDHADDVQGRRFAGIAIGVFLGLTCEYLFLRMLVDLFLRHRGSPFSGLEFAGTLFWLTFFCGGTIVMLSMAFYFSRVYPRPAVQYFVRPLAVSIAAPLVLAMLVALVPSITACDSGDAAFWTSRYERAIREYSTCLQYPNLTADARADALQSRAAAHSAQREYADAVVDHERAFKTRPARGAEELRRYSFALLHAGRPLDALEAATAAERAGRGRVGAYVHLAKGRAYLALKRYEEAASSLTHVIADKPASLYLFWWRGQAYEGLGRKDLAKRDFEEFARLFGLDAKQAKFENVVMPEPYQEKLRAYKIDADPPR